MIYFAKLFAVFYDSQMTYIDQEIRKKYTTAQPDLKTEKI